MAPAETNNSDSTESFLYNFTKALDDSLSDVLVWWPVFFIGLGLLVAEYMRNMGYATNRMKTGRSLRNFGWGIVVLNIYHNESMRWLTRGQPFLITCFLICFDEGLRMKLHRELGYRWDAGVKVKRGATNIYRDVTCTLRETIIVFWTQGMLFILYFWYVNNDEDTHDFKQVSIFKWLLALCITDIMPAQQCGDQFSLTYWDRLWADPNIQKIDRYKSYLLTFIPTRYTRQFELRKCMEFAIHGACRGMILRTFPLLLATEEAMDFVKDIAAVFYITQLDERSDGDTADVVLRKLHDKIKHKEEQHRDPQ